MDDVEWSKYVEKAARRMDQKDKQLQALIDLDEWVAQFKEVEYNDYRLQVKAELDRHVSRYFSKLGRNHAKVK